MARTLAASRTSGFTLIELMVAVSVLAVVAMLAAPAMTELVASQRMRTAAYNMVGDLVLARSEAIKRQEDIAITPESPGWANGWRVTVTSTAEIISRKSSVGNGVNFVAAPESITFNREGRMSGANVVRFNLWDGGASKRCISLDPSGRPRSASTACPA